jgi:hypothetical protein
MSWSRRRLLWSAASLMSVSVNQAYGSMPLSFARLDHVGDHVPVVTDVV